MLGAVQAALLGIPKSAPKTYATWNPADKDASLTLSNGNLTVSRSAANWGSVRATMSKTTGVWSYEMYINTVSAVDYHFIGVAISTAQLGLNGFWAANGYSGGSYQGGTCYWNGVSSQPSSTGIVAGDYLGVKIDMSDAANVTQTFYKNGTSYGSLTKARSASGAAYFPAYSLRDTNAATANFGQTNFAYPILGNGIDGIYI